MSSLNGIQQPAIAWLADQQRFGQNIFLMIDRLAEPDPLPELFAQDLMQDYVNLYQVCGWEELASIGPWLIRLADNQTEQLTSLLETPQRNWGWLASAPQLTLSELTAHWQDRILSEQNDARALYRFQDNRVIGHHLRSLANQQLPLLLGPLYSTLCWHQGAWLTMDNPAPGFQPPPFDRPWLDVAELSTVQRGILFHNLQQWLWEEHPESTARLASTEPLAAWLASQLHAAAAWSWQEPEQLRFLLRHKLQSQSAHDAVWAPNDGETPAEHYRRCNDVLRSRTYS